MNLLSRNISDPCLLNTLQTQNTRHKNASQGVYVCFATFVNVTISSGRYTRNSKAHTPRGAKCRECGLMYTLPPVPPCRPTIAPQAARDAFLRFQPSRGGHPHRKVQLRRSRNDRSVREGHCHGRPLQVRENSVNRPARRKCAVTHSIGTWRS